MWLSGNLYHIGWNANYELWLNNPIQSIPIAHGLWDPHFGLSVSEAYSISAYYEYAVVLSYSGLYNWMTTVGFSSVFQIYNGVLLCELVAVCSLLLGKMHLLLNESLLQWFSKHSLSLFSAGIGSFLWPVRLGSVLIEASTLRANFHTGVLIGFTSLAWSGHLLHVAIPVSRSTNMNIAPPQVYSLTLDGGLKSDTASLYLSDIAHHHIAIGILFVWLGHLYSSLYKAFGHRYRSLWNWNLQTSYTLTLAVSLAIVGTITSVQAQHVYSLSPYFYLAYDYVTTVCLYVHHQTIAEFIMVASCAHFTIYLGRDHLDGTQGYIDRIIGHKHAILSHLSWVSLWLGFHTLGLYVHNDTLVAFGEPDKQILIEPTNAQYIQSLLGNNELSCLLTLGAGDTYAHHAIALGLHVTVLILLKGALTSRRSKLMPDKLSQQYGYACDGPGRGGTCDISAWDSFYLAIFWMLNTHAWINFYFHWKHLTIWTATVSQFDEGSLYLNAWFRDYLWFNSAPLIRGYDTFGSNDLSVWSWLFLGAHLCWATGFMFLISWRGYWQELIDIILYMHLKTPILYDLWYAGFYTPVALSIVQARFIGLVHFASGLILTYPPFVIGATT